jgi:hypothetical protein
LRRGASGLLDNLRLFEPAVDLGVAIGDVAAGERLKVGVMVRAGAVCLSALAGVALLSAVGASAQSAPERVRIAQSAQPVSVEVSAQRRVRRPPTRLRVYRDYDANPNDVYPRYYPGRNAVRECNATYVQEYRPSGTVIVPHMSCFWRPG